MKILLFCLGVAFLAPLQALDLTIETPDGYVVMDVDSHHQISEIQEEIELLLNFPIDQQIILVKNYDYSADKKNAASPVVRDYNANVLPNEKNDIRFIVTTLADKPIYSLLKYHEDLVQAGKRIKHVHPLRFLMVVFTDEELKVGITNIHKKGGWVWSDFVGGLNESLQEEAFKNNLRDDQIIDFAKIVGVDSSAIFPSIRNKKWTDLVVRLITIVPRDPRSGRYDM